MKAIARRTARNAFTHRIDIRQHQLTADEPTEHGGDDEGPSPQELLAAAGESMPPKSTYFFPKVPTGLLFNPLDE